ncbi:MAG: 30S ribosomal protein S9 [Bacteroidia bacterium]|nr:30S ribosomal protein S9 [Bacteroidia bacterium]MDW8333787.1 30S ribosomal protein S9 [Bacteroidia bacterium]
MSYTVTVGRRKTAVARVFMRPATSETGKFEINGRDFEHYLNNEVLKMKVNKPFELLSTTKERYDVKVNVSGGGINGQAEAIRLGISRALQMMNPEVRPILKKEGLLSVDSRQVERKKYGRRKARRRFQFSKR